MKNDPTQVSCAEILAELESLAKETQAFFGGFSPKQLNWKPAAEVWSIGQCFEHLISANQGFFPQIDEVIRREKKTSLWQRAPIFPGIFGKLVIGAVSPQSPRKIKAPKIFQPTASAIDPLIIPKFLAQQQEVIDKIKATSEQDPKRVIIYSPVSKAVIYSLLDAYRIIAAHERRHFIQARRLMETPGFPA